MMNRPASRRKNQRAAAIAVVVFLGFLGCAAVFATQWVWGVVSSFWGSAEPAAWEPSSAELTVAVSPVMAPVLGDLAEAFNEQGRRAADGQSLVVTVVTYDPEELVGAAARPNPPFQAISPDSSLWLAQLEQRWAEGDESASPEGGAAIPLAQRRIGAQLRYAVSPIVLAAWEDVALRLGWPDRPVSWQDVQQRATQDPSFKWSHASTRHASGLLAVLAEFYAGAGLTRGLTVAAATDPATLAYVQAVEGTVRFYGENEDQVFERLRQQGREFLDLFVAQERLVIDWNRQHPEQQLVALYPAEGTLWTDHPLALLELGQRLDEPSVTANQRYTFQSFADYLTSEPSQRQLLAAGYRPADLAIALDEPGSPFADTIRVDWRQPQTTLQMPPPEVVAVVSDFWYYTKRPTNVYLVVDTSGSMEGSKLQLTQNALKSFLEQIRGSRDRVGIVEFGNELKSYTQLATLDDAARQQLNRQIDRMTAEGGTALNDAVFAAATALQQENQADAINAVVVMTDGLENQSQRSLRDLRNLLAGTPGLPIVVFTIGFGQDADTATLEEMARIGGGQYRRASEADLDELYRIISTYF